MWYWFVETGWLYCMLVMGIILTVQLIVKWKDWNVLRKLGAFTVIILVLYVWEEWVIPGRFHYYYNIASDAVLRDRYPMNELTDMITNFGGALIDGFRKLRKDFGNYMNKICAIDSETS